MTVRTVHVMVSGLVQGVGYRAWTEREANARRLSGWVRNRRGGEVEAVFTGDPADVAAMLSACHAGPRMARVSAVDVDELDSAEPGPFRVLPDA
ncbi:acylphosphatase [Kaistia defluvii]|uniref:acylphosphatase n=1 Tax=Kaistia defluvii TaxID=410841 RepID=UPI002254654D|nr:acylphosphatase [Kaistia defluvii]MCX5519924.1 acylphosphatase [Kaistia defluvii]